MSQPLFFGLQVIVLYFYVLEYQVETVLQEKNVKITLSFSKTALDIIFCTLFSNSHNTLSTRADYPRSAWRNPNCSICCSYTIDYKCMSCIVRTCFIVRTARCWGKRAWNGSLTFHDLHFLPQRHPQPLGGSVLQETPRIVVRWLVGNRIFQPIRRILSRYTIAAARHISEGAAPCPYRLAPCPKSLAPCPICIAPWQNLKKKQKNFTLYIILISVFVFSDSRWTVNRLQICAHVFIDRPQNHAQISFRSRAGQDCAQILVVHAHVPDFLSFAR